MSRVFFSHKWKMVIKRLRGMFQGDKNCVRGLPIGSGNEFSDALNCWGCCLLGFYRNPGLTRRWITGVDPPRSGSRETLGKGMSGTRLGRRADIRLTDRGVASRKTAPGKYIEENPLYSRNGILRFKPRSTKFEHIPIASFSLLENPLFCFSPENNFINLKALLDNR